MGRWVLLRSMALRLSRANVNVRFKRGGEGRGDGGGNKILTKKQALIFSILDAVFQFLSI